MSITISQGAIVKLEPHSRHGKNRINQHGDRWVVSTFRGQPAVHLRSMDKTFKMGSSWVFDGRWVLLQNDENFTIQVDKSA